MTNPFTQKAREKPKLKPFGASGSKTGTTSGRPRTARKSSTVKLSKAQRKKKPVTPESHGKLTYLLTLGYMTKKYRGKWVIADRFSVIQPDEKTYTDHRLAQKRADELNREAREMCQKELAKL